MKMQIIISENIATLRVTADSAFDRDMLESLDRLKHINTEIRTTQEWGVTTLGYIDVSFATKEKGE